MCSSLGEGMSHCSSQEDPDEKRQFMVFRVYCREKEKVEKVEKKIPAMVTWRDGEGNVEREGARAQEKEQESKSVREEREEEGANIPLL